MDGRWALVTEAPELISGTGALERGGSEICMDACARMEHVGSNWLDLLLGLIAGPGD